MNEKTMKTQQVHPTTNTSDKQFLELFSSFQSEQTAEQLIDDIHQSRLFQREIEEF